MARQVVVAAGPFAAASATRFVNAAIPVSGTTQALTTTVVDTVQRRILVTYGNEGSARTLVLTGTNASGNVITETIAIPSGGASTAISVLDYLTLTSAMPLGGGWTAALSLGTIASTTAGSSPWVRLSEYGFAQTDIIVDVSGTVNYTVEYSNDDPNLVAPQSPVAVASMVWVPDATLAAQTTSKQVALSATPLWARVTANSYTTTGTATMAIHQMGGGNR